MLNMFRMDMRRLLHSKVFWVSVIFLTIMAVAMPMSGMSMNLDAMMGAGGIGAEEDFMVAMMGPGVIFILLSIILTLFICGDYSGGFAKNIFTAHAQPKDYIGGKMLSMAVTAGLLLVLYLLESLITLSIFGYSIALSGGVLGLIAFMIQKWLIACAFSGLIILVNLLTRNSALGIIMGFICTTGGLSMGIAILGQLLGLEWFGMINRVFISGVSQLCTLTFSGIVFIQVLIVCAIWMTGCYIGSSKVLAAKDV